MVAVEIPVLRRRRAFQRALHAWYRVHQRRLPWRTEPSLYRTVVSEFMLQQTQVKTVLPYFDRWMAALPDFAALAAAPEARVLKLWEGLGYYSRARRLHALARQLAGRPDFPRTAAGWLELPGIGPYTAAAIASIACDEPAAVVDGNVVRILARLAGVTRRFRDGGEAVKYFTPLAAGLIRGAPPGLHNQAMMELGATVCLRQSPRCGACPVAQLCAARAAGSAAALPRFQPRRAEPMSVIRIFCMNRGRLLLRREDGKAKRLAGLHELPAAVDLGVKPAAASLLATKRRAITRFQVTEAIHAVQPSAKLRERVSRDQTLEWIRVGDLGRVTLSGPHRRWIGELLARVRGSTFRG
ncbi:MAG TPA: A/G-specific adenine glycosylase [Lacunisphaera sp.]|nr:A/G-specific adenine glycosylase [Lacunisphaera sp.]